MKNTAKVFIWIGMILQCFLVFPIVIGIIALKKINEAQTTDGLQTFGILTIFFCSFLGGIFMLNIKEEDLQENLGNEAKAKAMPTAHDCSRDLMNQCESKEIVILNSIGIGILSFLLVVCFVFSCGAASTYYSGETPALFNIYQFLLIIPIVVLLCLNKGKFNKISLILLIAFALVSVGLIVMSIITNYCFAYYYDRYYNTYLERWIYDYYWGGFWEYWVVFGFACAMIVVSIALIIANLAKKQVGNIQKTKNVKSVEVIVSGIEAELKEVKRLLNEGLISEEEYNKMRASVISKYYK